MSPGEPAAGVSVIPSAAAPARADGMRRAFREATKAHPGALSVEEYVFAGRPVRLRIVGRRLAERTHRAFAHLRRDGAPAARPFYIDVWDESETGGQVLPQAAAMELDRRWVACDGTLTASPDGRYVSFRYEESVTLLDRQEQSMISCRRSGSHLSTGDCSKPYVLMLSIWYHDRGVQLLHAGLVAHERGGLLLPGASGTGKSTAALAAVTQGLDFLGDDFVGLERVDGGAFRGHSIFSTVCLTRQTLARFAEVRPHAVEDSFEVEDKPIVYVSELYPARIRDTVPIRAVVLLSKGHARTEITPARRADALRAFAASTLHTVVPRPGREALDRLAALVERVPAYWLRLGPRLEDIGPSLSAIAST